jgi:pSer/pThr/pTyr-binding forkhead associated (FHA) protein
VGEAPPAAPSKSVRWQLRVVHKDRPECVLPLEDKPVTIGRGRENAIAVRCDRVSREHARFRLDEHRPRVDDLGSRNGILVNGVKVPAAYLKPNDEVKIGSVRIYLEAAE